MDKSKPIRIELYNKPTSFDKIFRWWLDYKLERERQSLLSWAQEPDLVEWVRQHSGHYPPVPSDKPVIEPTMIHGYKFTRYKSIGEKLNSAVCALIARKDKSRRAIAKELGITNGILDMIYFDMKTQGYEEECLTE